MGASHSKKVVNNLTKSISKIAAKSVQDCEILSDSKQSLEVNNSGTKLFGNYTMEQTTDIEAECFTDSQREIKLKNKIAREIAQTIEKEGLTDVFGLNISEAEANIKTILHNEISMENIQRNYNNIKQAQSAKFNNSGITVFENVKMTQGSKIFAASTLQEMDRIGIINDIEDKVKQKYKSQSTFSAMSPTLIAIIFIVFFSVVAVVYILKKKKV